MAELGPRKASDSLFECDAKASRLFQAYHLLVLQTPKDKPATSAVQTRVTDEEGETSVKLETARDETEKVTKTKEQLYGSLASPSISEVAARSYEQYRELASNANKLSSLYLLRRILKLQIRIASFKRDLFPSYTAAIKATVATEQERKERGKDKESKEQEAGDSQQAPLEALVSKLADLFTALDKILDVSELKDLLSKNNLGLYLINLKAIWADPEIENALRVCKSVLSSSFFSLAAYLIDSLETAAEITTAQELFPESAAALSAVFKACISFLSVQAQYDSIHGRSLSAITQTKAGGEPGGGGDGSITSPSSTTPGASPPGGSGEMVGRPSGASTLIEVREILSLVARARATKRRKEGLGSEENNWDMRRVEEEEKEFLAPFLPDLLAWVPTCCPCYDYSVECGTNFNVGATTTCVSTYSPSSGTWLKASTVEAVVDFFQRSSIKKGDAYPLLSEQSGERVQKAEEEIRSCLLEYKEERLNQALSAPSFLGAFLGSPPPLTQAAIARWSQRIEKEGENILLEIKQLSVKDIQNFSLSLTTEAGHLCPLTTEFLLHPTFSDDGELIVPSSSAGVEAVKESDEGEGSLEKERQKEPEASPPLFYKFELSKKISGLLQELRNLARATGASALGPTTTFLRGLNNTLAPVLSILSSHFAPVSSYLVLDVEALIGPLLHVIQFHHDLLLLQEEVRLLLAEGFSLPLETKDLYQTTGSPNRRATDADKDAKAKERGEKGEGGDLLPSYSVTNYQKGFWAGFEQISTLKPLFSRCCLLLSVTVGNLSELISLRLLEICKKVAEEEFEAAVYTSTPESTKPSNFIEGYLSRVVVPVGEVLPCCHRLTAGSLLRELYIASLRSFELCLRTAKIKISVGGSAILRKDIEALRTAITALEALCKLPEESVASLPESRRMDNILKTVTVMGAVRASTLSRPERGSMDSAMGAGSTFVAVTALPDAKFWLGMRSKTKLAAASVGPSPYTTEASTRASSKQSLKQSVRSSTG